LAIYGVRKYLLNSKTAEVRNAVGQMAKDAKAAYERESMASTVLAGGSSASVSNNLCTDATKTVPAPYNAADSGGSNLGPTSKALSDRIKEDVDKLKAENPSMPVPVDLVTTSASGLDPDILPEAALFQVPRIAKVRNMPEDRVRQLVAEKTEGRLAGFLGEPRVNVLVLNMALDAAASK
jgi:K+-transporting ATPase KdpC subunit